MAPDGPGWTRIRGFCWIGVRRGLSGLDGLIGVGEEDYWPLMNTDKHRFLAEMFLGGRPARGFVPVGWFEPFRQPVSVLPCVDV